MGRASTPPSTETIVLTQSKRRCCLCFHLENDLKVKQGQIAHVDKDSSNAKLKNLAFLCLPHHDQYDSKTSQSKGITKGEIEFAQKALFKELGTSSDSEVVVVLKFPGSIMTFDSASINCKLENTLGKGSFVVESITQGSVKLHIKFKASLLGKLSQALAANSLHQEPVSIEQIEFVEASSSPECPGSAVAEARPDYRTVKLLDNVNQLLGDDFPLAIEEETIAGKQVLFVDTDALAACFDADIDEAFVKALAGRAPGRAVFRDASYRTDSVKINVEQIFKLLSPKTSLRCI